MNWRSAKFAYAFRRTALPLLAYYAVTIVLPLANGATQSGAAFVEHALVVLVVPPLVVLFAFAMCALVRAGCAYAVSNFSRTTRLRAATFWSA